MRFMPKLGLTAATVFASAGLLLPFAGSAGASTACVAPKAGSCQQHTVRHAVHRKAEHHSKGEHHSKSEHHAKHEHHQRCRHHEHHHFKRCHHHSDDRRDD